MQIGRHNPFHLGKHPRPGERLARKQLVEELRLIGDIAIRRLVQHGPRLRILLVEAVDLPPHLRPVAG